MQCFHWSITSKWWECYRTLCTVRSKKVTKTYYKGFSNHFTLINYVLKKNKYVPWSLAQGNNQASTIRKCSGQESSLTTSSLHEDDWGRVSRFSVSKIFMVFKFVFSSLHWLGKLWYSFPTAIHLIALKIKYGLCIIEKHFLKEKATT